MAAAALVGILVGLALRPLLDAYLAFTTARMYARDDALRTDEWKPQDERSDVR